METTENDPVSVDADAPLSTASKVFASILLLAAFITGISLIIRLWPAATLDPNSVVPKCYSVVLTMVAIAGFLGNLIHVSTSFVVFVGAKKYASSWSLWYVVKPFTAAALALVVFFALNSTGTTMPTNLNGVLATAALSGLFTDIATQKLREIFTAIFKPDNTLPGKITDETKTASINIAAIKPAKVDLHAPNMFEIPGKNLDPKNIVVKINNLNVDAITVTANLI